VLQKFIALKNPSPQPGLNLQTFDSNGKHTNHYATKATNRLWMVKRNDDDP
jgi:hypothetical protein